MPKLIPEFKDPKIKSAVALLIRTIEKTSGLTILELSMATMDVADSRTPAGMVRSWHRWRASGKKQAMPSKHKLRGILHVAKRNHWLPQELPEALVGLISLVEAEALVDLEAQRSRSVALMEEHADKAFNTHRMSTGSSIDALEYTVELCGQVLANVISRRWQLEYSPQLGAELAAAYERGLQKAQALVQEEIEFHKTGDQKIDPSQAAYPPDLPEGEPESVGFPNLKSQLR